MTYAFAGLMRLKAGPLLRSASHYLGSRLLAFDLFTPRWAYVARVFLAASIALGLAYYLNLETPYSAATTVFLVAHPIQGITLSKGAWRIIGSTLGAVVAILLIAVFSQAPVLFFAGFALWLGLCVGTATLLRHFRSYGAVVAGYTIGLVIYGAIDTPALIFDHAIGRVSVVTLGVVSLGLTTSLLSRRNMADRLETRLTQLTAAVGHLTAASLAPIVETDQAHSTKRYALVGDIYGMDDLLAFSSAESAHVAVRANEVRQAVTALFAVLVGGSRRQFLHAGTSVEAARMAIQIAFGQAAQMLDAGSAATPKALRIIDNLRQELNAVQEAAEMRRPTPGGTANQDCDPAFFTELVTLVHLGELAAAYENALAGLARLRGASPRASAIRFRFHLDWLAAIHNGIRATIAVMCAAAFWIATAWSSAPLMILLIAPFCGLLALTPNPVAASVEFTKGIAVAVAAGFVCTFAVLPHVSGFPLLIAALAPFWIAGLYATINPKTAAAGTAYLLTFMTMVGPTNSMHYDVAAYLNSALAFLLSGFFTLLSFRLLFPPDTERDATRIEAVIRRDMLETLGTTHKLHRLAFEHLQHQRLARLGQILKGNPGRLNRILPAGFATLHIDRAVLRIRETIVTDDLPAVVRFLVWHGLQNLHQRRSDPRTLAAVARYTAGRLVTLDPTEPEVARTAHRLAASFFDIANLFETHVDFLVELMEK